MSKFPKINYIGNKKKISPWILDNLPIKEGIFLDLFSGGGAVSYEAKKRGFEIIGNDILYSNYILNKAIIENNFIKLEDKDFLVNIPIKLIEKKYVEINFLNEVLYYKNEVLELAKYLCVAETYKSYKKFMMLSLIRRAMIRKLPYSRMNIPWKQIIKLRDEEYSYEKYGRKRAYHNKSFKELIFEDLDNYNNAIFFNGLNHKIYNLDYKKLIKKIEFVDLIYLDPPYPSTMNKYSDFYGMYDKMLDKEKIKYTNLTSKDTFLNEIEKLLKNVVEKTKFVVLSLNDNVKPSVEEFVKIFEKYGVVSVLNKKHQYKVTGKKNKNLSKEILIILEVNLYE